GYWGYQFRSSLLSFFSAAAINNYAPSQGDESGAEGRYQLRRRNRIDDNPMIRSGEAHYPFVFWKPEVSLMATDERSPAFGPPIDAEKQPGSRSSKTFRFLQKVKTKIRLHRDVVHPEIDPLGP